jgi:uncharacterized protein YwqG
MEEELRERLRRAGLARVADDIMRLAAPAIRLECRRADEAAIPVGASKLGGAPDLPSEHSWPEGHGEAMAFIAQIQLDEIAPFDAEGDLPHVGMLSFFFATDCEPKASEDDNNPETWKVLHFESELTSLVRQPVPANRSQWKQFPACAMTYARRPTLPDVESAEVLALGLTNEERNAYIEVEGGADVGYLPEMDHRLLGYPYTLEPHPFLEGYLARNGIERPVVPRDPAEQERKQRAMAELQEAAKEWRPPAEGYQSPDDVWQVIADFRSRVDMAPLLRAIDDLQPTPAPPGFQAHMEALQQAAAVEWRLLLQVYSNEEAEMDWAGGGVLHFCIAKDVLAARDFGGVWVNLQFV